MSLHGWVLTHLTGVLKEEDPDAHTQERPGKDTESAHHLHTQDSGLWENAPVYFQEKPMAGAMGRGSLCALKRKEGKVRYFMSAHSTSLARVTSVLLKHMY